jgi:predicted nucleotidyltransferase
MIDVTPEQLEIILGMVSQFFPDCEVWVFGSRYNGTAKHYSDLDLALVGQSKLDWRRLAELKEAFQESDLPFRVDLCLTGMQFRRSFVMLLKRAGMR